MFLCLLGLLLGFIGYLTYYKSYEIYSLSRHYTQVNPSDSPGAFRDGGVIDFTSDTYVDAYKGVGYRNGVTFCVAPILGARSSVPRGARPSANFWAAGTDCCHHRGDFHCGDVGNLSVHSGLVILDATPAFDNEIPMFMKAAEQSAAQNDLSLPHRPIFVRWTNNIQGDIDHYSSSATTFVVVASLSLMFIMMFTVICCNGLHVPPDRVGSKPDFFDKSLVGPGGLVEQFFSEKNYDGDAKPYFARQYTMQEHVPMNEAGEETTFTGHGSTIRCCDRD